MSGGKGRDKMYGKGVKMQGGSRSGYIFVMVVQGTVQ
jgi:hypothetical protein